MARATRTIDPQRKLAPATPTLTFAPVTAATRGDFEALFTTPGAPHYCWCMVWRRTSDEAKHHENDDRRRQMLGRIRAGVPVGLIGYADGAPSAWVSIAPRDTHRASALGSPEPDVGEVVWSLVCFFVLRKLRGQGTIHHLIEAAVAHARAAGATIVEAYPVDEAAPSYRFMGFVPTFTKAGFAEIARAGARRHVMQLRLS
jgi:GNAT superfamily N-acetyltransferase